MLKLHFFEAIFNFTNQEIPYQTNVITQKIIKTKSVKIYQNLVVKNKNQQRIIIGKSGKMLKLIGNISRKQLEEILKFFYIYLTLSLVIRMIWTDEGYLVKIINYSENSIIANFFTNNHCYYVELSA